MQSNRLMLGIFLLLGAMAVGWRLGGWQATTRCHDARRDLLHEISQNQQKLDECYLNMANQFTPGFRTSLPLLWLGEGRPTLNTAQGQVFRTGTATNVAVQGPGFMLVGSASQPVYTRDGRFVVEQGVLQDSLGRPVLGYGRDTAELTSFPKLTDPLSRLRLDELGQVYIEGRILDPVTGQFLVSTDQVFTLALAEFPHPEFLARFGTTGLVATRDSGQARLGSVSSLQSCILCPGSLELSNVDFQQQGLMIHALRNQAGLLTMPMPMPGAPPPPNIMSSQPPAKFLPGMDPLSR